MSRPSRFDILVIGGGPAGLSLAAETADRGLDVGVLAPSHPPEWPNNYGAWRDTFPDDELAACTSHTWPHPVVVFEDDTRRTLDRTYVRIDNEALREALIERCHGGDVRWTTGWAEDVRHTPEGSKVSRRDDETLKARLVVDATGPGGRLLESTASREPALQTAHGIVARCEGDPLAGDAMHFMNYSRAHLPETASDDVPSFLYGMHLGGERYFLEETRLADRPPLPAERLETRLEHRLQSRSIEIHDVLETEHVSIPMDPPLPDRPQRTLGFGATSGMVHPASGFSVTRSLRRASDVAGALADSMARGVSARQVARDGWEAVWPRELCRTRQLHLFGLEMMLELDASTLSSFFQAFFELPESDWSTYLSADASPAETARIMLTLFGRAPFSLKRTITSTSFSPSAQHLIDGLLPSTLLD